MTETLRPKGTVERTCDLCHWASWYDPLSAEATVIPFVCLPCKVNELTGVVCSSCNRWFKRGHRDLATTPVDSVTGMVWYRCDECEQGNVPVGVLAEVRYCQGHVASKMGAGNPLVSTCGKVSYVRTSVAGQPDYFVDLCFECFGANRSLKSEMSKRLKLEEPVIMAAGKYSDQKAPKLVTGQSFTEMLQSPGMKKMLQERVLEDAVKSAAVAHLLAESYPPRSPWKPPSWRERARSFVRAKWDRLRYRVGCMIAGVPLDDDEGC